MGVLRFLGTLKKKCHTSSTLCLLIIYAVTNKCITLNATRELTDKYRKYIVFFN